MNRQIIFRGKSKRNGELLYGDLVRNVEGTFAIVPPFEIDLHNHCERYEVDEDTIGQFTGFCDKDGKEIYEGDILSYVFTKVKYLVYYSYLKCSLSFNPCGNVDMDSIIHNSWMDVNIYGKVDGNEYDNPELIDNDYHKI